MRMRMTIEHEAASISLYYDDAWHAVAKPFRVTTHQTNAVIIGMNHGTDSDGTWVETWSLSVTQINWRTLQVLFNRHVNNKDLARDDADAAWWVFGYGNVELQGTAP